MPPLNTDFKLVQKINSDGFLNQRKDPEASNYQGLEYLFKNKKYLQRTARQTSKKTGQFVSLWKRTSKGDTSPYSSSDGYDFVVIICWRGKTPGKFLFPKKILIEKGIFSDESSGKRGFRVYPPWDKPQNKQALSSQAWQLKFFSKNLKL